LILELNLLWQERAFWDQAARDALPDVTSNARENGAGLFEGGA